MKLNYVLFLYFLLCATTISSLEKSKDKSENENVQPDQGITFVDKDSNTENKENLINKPINKEYVAIKKEVIDNIEQMKAKMKEVIDPNVSKLTTSEKLDTYKNIIKNQNSFVKKLMVDVVEFNTNEGKGNNEPTKLNNVKTISNSKLPVQPPNDNFSNEPETELSHTEKEGELVL